VEEGRENTLPLPPDLEADAVHVMTIHGAKGLDFEHVYVAQIHKGSRGGGRMDSGAKDAGGNGAAALRGDDQGEAATGRFRRVAQVGEGGTS
jgi:ATP-dependent exoDNAse (exonuclease V) beta subunit